MNPVQAVVLGVVEGRTEFLPVSSTGHLTVTEGPLRGVAVVAVALIAWSAVMWYAERRPAQDRGESALTVRDGAVIGLVQCAALVPGVSRSGATISAGLLRGIDR